MKPKPTKKTKLKPQLKKRRKKRKETQELLPIDELAPKVSNDISEDIDCGESRHALRAVISWWVDEFHRQVNRTNAIEGRLMLLKAKFYKAIDEDQRPWNNDPHKP